MCKRLRTTAETQAGPGDHGVTLPIKGRDGIGVVLISVSTLAKACLRVFFRFETY